MTRVATSARSFRPSSFPLAREPSTLLVAPSATADRAGAFKTRFSSCRYSRIFCCSWFSQPARSETRKICGETNVLIASIIAEVTYGCGR